MSEEERGGITVSEAGRRGGERTAQTHSHKFYEETGQKGGEAGGTRGGRTTRDKYGHEFYEEIGRKGGRKVRELVEEGKKAEGSLR